MLDWIITTSLKNRLLIAVLATLLIFVGGKSLLHLPIDAFPDTTPVQVQINTTVPAFNAEEAEAQITIPVELAIGGLPIVLAMMHLSNLLPGRFGSPLFFSETLNPKP
jgi:cobalt-zinc-cadmium resistance protein CzcA